MSKDWQAVSTAINTRMAELTMSQTDLAQRSGVSPATLRKLQWNYPDTRPRRRTLEDIARALGWTADHLVNLLNGEAPAVANPASTGSELEQLRNEVGCLRTRLESVESELREWRASE